MRALKAWLPTLVWMLIIFLFSNNPTLTASVINWQDFFIKKTAHFIEYFILSLLVYRSFHRTTNASRAKLIVYSVIFSTLYAISDEYHQSFVPGRGPNIRDVFIDSVGAAAAQIIYNRFT